MKKLKLFSFLALAVIMTLSIIGSGCKPATNKPDDKSKTGEVKDTSDKNQKNTNTEDIDSIKLPQLYDDVGVASIIYPDTDGTVSNICTKDRAGTFVLNGNSVICGIQGVITQAQYGSYPQDDFCTCYS